MAEEEITIVIDNDQEVTLLELEIMPKSILGIVKYLRERGELDENAWREFKRSMVIRNLVVLFFAATACGAAYYLSETFEFIVVAVISIIFWWAAIKVLRDRCKLNTAGLVTVGEVVSVYFRKWDLNRASTGYIFCCKFVDLNNILHTSKCEIIDPCDTKIDRPEVGDRVEIVYLPHNPKKTAMYRHYFDSGSLFTKVNQYNLRNDGRKS